MIAGTLVAAGLAQGAMYALVALALVLIYKTQSVVNFAQGEIFMAGAFGSYALVTWGGFSYLATFAVIVPAGFILGVVIERLLIRRIAGDTHVALAMVTVGLSITLQGLARIPFGADIYSFPALAASPPIVFGPVVVTRQALAVILVTVATAVLLSVLFAFTATGRRMRATQQSPSGARIVGIDVERMFTLTWGISASVGALAGIVAGPLVMLYPDMGAKVLVKGFAAAVLGGFTSIGGAVVGGFLIGLIEIFFGAYVSDSIQDVSSFFIIILALLLRPQGLFGRKEVARV